MGEAVSINYNAFGFPAATDYAAIVEQNGEFVVVGTSSNEEAGTIEATMPIGFGNSNDPYNLYIIPYQPETPGGDLKVGETIEVDQEEDYLVIEGQNPGFASDYTSFQFNQAGDRSMSTRPFDFTDVSSATLDLL